MGFVKSKLFEYIRESNLEAVMAVIDDYNIEEKDSYGRTPLLMAAAYGKSKPIVDFLVYRGASIFATRNDGWNFMMAASFGGYIDYVKDLIENHGFDVNNKDLLGRTALMGAVAGEHLDVVQYLVEKGVDINAITTYGETALSHAIKKNKVKMVEYLNSVGVKR